MRGIADDEYDTEADQRVRWKGYIGLGSTELTRWFLHSKGWGGGGVFAYFFTNQERT